MTADTWHSFHASIIIFIGVPIFVLDVPTRQESCLTVKNDNSCFEGAEGGLTEDKDLIHVIIWFVCEKE